MKRDILSDHLLSGAFFAAILSWLLLAGLTSLGFLANGAGSENLFLLVPLT